MQKSRALYYVWFCAIAAPAVTALESPAGTATTQDYNYTLDRIPELNLLGGGEDRSANPLQDQGETLYLSCDKPDPRFPFVPRDFLLASYLAVRDLALKDPPDRTAPEFARTIVEEEAEKVVIKVGGGSKGFDPLPRETLLQLLRGNDGLGAPRDRLQQCQLNGRSTDPHIVNVDTVSSPDTRGSGLIAQRRTRRQLVNRDANGPLWPPGPHLDIKYFEEMKFDISNFFNTVIGATFGVAFDPKLSGVQSIYFNEEFGIGGEIHSVTPVPYLTVAGLITGLSELVRDQLARVDTQGKDYNGVGVDIFDLRDPQLRIGRLDMYNEKGAGARKGNVMIA